MGERGENVENHLGEELKHEKSFRGRIKTTYLKKRSTCFLPSCTVRW